MKLKNILLLFISLCAVATFSSCRREAQIRYVIDVEDAACTNLQQTLVVDFWVHQDAINAGTQFYASSDASWATVSEITVKGNGANKFLSFDVNVEENSGDTRVATISISATNCITKEVKICQYSAPSNQGVANHTLMYYFFGTSLNRFFKTNLEDATAAIEAGALGNNNRVVFFRQESEYSGYIGELRYESEGKKCIEQRLKSVTLPAGVIKPERIGEMIAEMAGIAPAERYGIIFAGHGQGWVTRELLMYGGTMMQMGVGANPWIPAPGAEITRAFGEGNVQVNIDELAEGIEKSQVALDYILFDACFMSNIESIYELRNAANYIIASPCEIMSRGFPYHRTLAYLFAEDGKKTDYKGAAESYYKFYRDEFVGNARSGCVAVYDCSEIETLAEATRAVMATAKLGYKEVDTSIIQTYEGLETHQFYDFGEWVNVVAMDSEALAAFNAQMEKTIIAKHSLPTFYSAYGKHGTYNIDLNVYSGVTTSAPSKAFPAAWRDTNWNKEVIGLEN